MVKGCKCVKCRNEFKATMFVIVFLLVVMVSMAWVVYSVARTLLP